MHPCSLTLQEILAQSDVVVSAVPSASYKVKTEWLKDGCVCLNVAADKNFEKEVREKVRRFCLLKCVENVVHDCANMELTGGNDRLRCICLRSVRLRS